MTVRSVPVDVELMTIRELRDAFAVGKLSATDAVSAAAQARDKWHPVVNAVVTSCHERAMIEARSLTRLDDGFLSGIPFTVKDSIETAGVASTAGVSMYAGHVPADDAPAVARLRAAGALLVGKTNVPPLAGNVFTDNRLFGRTSNPWCLTRSSGGSSGGSATSVATRQSWFDLGSDTAGSLLVPAHFNGVCAHKASRGMIDNRGHIPPGPDRKIPHDVTTFGLLARTPDDLGWAMSPWLGEPVSDPDLTGRTVALWVDEMACPVEPAMVSAVEEAARRLAAAGCHVVSTPPLPSLEKLSRCAARLVGAARASLVPALSYVAYRNAVRELDHGGGITLLEELISGTVSSHRDWLELREQQLALTDELIQAFASVDGLVAPIAPTQAFRHPAGRRAKRDAVLAGYESLVSLAWSSPSTVCGVPSTAVPVEMHDGLPVGVQIITAPGADSQGIEFASRAGAPWSGLATTAHLINAEGVVT